MDSEAVWPYFYAGTMGHVQRDGIERLRHVKRYSRQRLDDLHHLVAGAGWRRSVGAKRGVDAREMAESDFIVVWGGNPVSTQVNVMTHIAKARKGPQAPSWWWSTPIAPARPSRPTCTSW